MNIVIQKYGGTSVGSLAHIRAVAEKVRCTKQRDQHVVVVVSAMAGDTDRLLQMAHKLSTTPNACELDALLATGEMVSAALLAIALQEIGCQAESFTGMQAGIMTDDVYTSARIKRMTITRVRAALEAGVIPVVAGFQGINDAQNFTTLGRGGSDLTAVALAAALKADICEIYTDVDGVYTADPRLVPEARYLAWISYDDMLELARAGAKVLQARAVEFAKQHDVPIVVKSAHTEGRGTLVTKAEAVLLDRQHSRSVLIK